MDDYKGPLPKPTPETAPFFEGLRERKVMLQRCKQCGPYFYPRPFCPSCFHWDVEWFQASGRGKLYSYVINYRPPPWFGERPIIVAVVELEECPRFMTNLVDVEPDPEKIKCDMPIVIDYADRTDEVTLPVARLA